MNCKLPCRTVSSPIACYSYMNPFIVVIRYTKKGFDLEKQVSVLFPCARSPLIHVSKYSSCQYRRLLAPLSAHWCTAYIKNSLRLLFSLLNINRVLKDI